MAPMEDALMEDSAQEQVLLHQLPLEERLALARKGPTLIFDGVCNLCNSSMRWYFERLTPGATVYFMWAQHEDTKEFLDELGIKHDDILRSWAYLQNGVMYRGSTAWSQAMQHLCRPWRWLSSLNAVPEMLREGAYGLVGRNRYNLYGRSDSCQRPAPAMAPSFLHSPLTRAGLAEVELPEDKLAVDGGKKRLLVIGCGPSGIQVARELASEFIVTVVDPKDYYEFTPGILRGICDAEHLKTLQVPLAEVLRGLNVVQVRGQVVGLGPHSAQVWVATPPGSEEGTSAVARDATADGESTSKKAKTEAGAASAQGEGNIIEVQFDYAVIAAGSQYAGSGLWKVTGAPGEESETSLAGRSTGLSSMRQKLLDLREKKGTAVLVGAGLVGTELAAELAHYMPGLRIILADLASTVLPTLPPRAQKYAHKWLEEHGVEMRLGAALPRGDEPALLAALGISGEAMVLGCSGVVMRCSFAAPLSCLDARGHVCVNRAMQCLVQSADGGPSEPALCAAGRIFALGDCCSVQGVTPYTKDIYPAEAMAEVIVTNLRLAKSVQCLSNASVPGVLRELSTSLQQMTLCSLGPEDCIYVHNGYVPLTGRAACFMKNQIESTKMGQYRHHWFGSLVWKVMPHF